MASPQFDTWLATLSDEDTTRFIASCRRQDEVWQRAIETGQVIKELEWDDPEDQEGVPRRTTFKFSSEAPHTDDGEWTAFNKRYADWCVENNLEILW